MTSQVARVCRQCWKDSVLNQSAMLSFYFLLSMFPLCMFLGVLLGFVFQSQPVLQATIHQSLAGVVPASAAALVDRTLGEVARGAGTLKFSVALLFTWWSASQGMMGIIDGLNTAYGVRESRPWWKKLLLTSTLTTVTLLLFAGAILLLIYGGRASALLAHHLGGGPLIAGVWQVLARALLLAFAVLAFEILYAYAPNIEHRRRRWLTRGTVVGVALWLVGSFGFRFYLSLFDTFTVTYGSLGAVIILLLWLYLTGIAILVGGEVNSDVERTRDVREERRARAPLRTS